MKVIRKGSYVRVENKGRWIEANFNDDGIIYVNYAEMPWHKGDTGVMERLGHLLKDPGKEYPLDIESLIVILKRIV